MTEQIEKIEGRAIDSEQMFDMLPFVVDIYDKINFDKYRKDLQKKYKEKKKENKKVDPLDAAIEATKFILKNSPKIKEEFFNIVAISDRKKVWEVKKQPFTKTLKSIKQIFSDPELMGFFKDAM